MSQNPPSSDTAQTPLTPPVREPLVRRVLRSGGVSLFGFGTMQVLRLASNLIMARLLTPEAFGLIAIAISLQVLMIMISDLGLNQSIVRTKSIDDPKFLETAFTLQVLRGAILGGVMFAGAGLVAMLAAMNVFPEKSVFADTRLPIFIAGAGIMLIVTGFLSLRPVLYQRDLKLTQPILVEIGSQIIGLIMMLVAFKFGAGAFSLLAGMLTTSSMSVIGSYVFLKGPVIGFGLNRTHFREIFDYGKWLLLASFLGFLIQRGDQFIFGTVMIDTQFGLYAIATTWITVAILLVDIIQQRVVYPTLSEVWRENPAGLTKVYENFRLAFDGLCIAIFAAIWIAGDFAFGLLYPDWYGGVADYMKLLSVIILFLPYRLLNTTILAEGRSRNFLTVTFGPALVILVGIPIMLHFTDVRTAIVFFTLSQVTSIPLSWWYTKRFLTLKAWRELPIGIFAILAAFIIATQFEF